MVIFIYLSYHYKLKKKVIRLQSEDIYVVGDGKTINSKLDVTFPTFSRIKGVKAKTFQELIEKSGKVASEVPVLICFPYALWDERVERGDNLYGVGDFGKRIRELSQYLTEILDKKFPQAIYVNHPMSLLLERDKLEVKNRLNEKGIKVAKNVEKTKDAVMKEIEAGHSVYVKVRFGSMGKGISYINPKIWTTNFNYDGKVIRNHEDDNNWKEIEITGDKYFLEKILEEDVIVEKAVKNTSTNGFKFDIRARSLFGESLEEFAYYRTSYNAVTNASQGAPRMPLNILLNSLPIQKQVNEALSLSERSAQILGLNYAGVDILFEGDEYEPVFLEINSFPGPHQAEKVLPLLHGKILKDLNIKYSHEMPNYLPQNKIQRRTA